MRTGPSSVLPSRKTRVESTDSRLERGMKITLPLKVLYSPVLFVLRKYEEVERFIQNHGKMNVEEYD